MWKLRILTVEHHPQINIDHWSLIGGDAVLKSSEADAQYTRCVCWERFPNANKLLRPVLYMNVRCQEVEVGERKYVD